MKPKKRLTALVMAAVMVLSLAGCGGSGLAAADFELRYDPVLWAVENGITFGITETYFGTEDLCKRSQVVIFLWRAKGKPEPTSTMHPFKDINTKAFYYKAMLWAVENSITAGMTSTTFAPNQTCTRGQVVTFLYRAFGQ